MLLRQDRGHASVGTDVAGSRKDGDGMTLGGETVGRPHEKVVLGSARAIGALSAQSRLTLGGACVVGPGAVEGLAVLARASAWDAIELPSGVAPGLLLAEPAPSRAAARHVLAQAAAAHMIVYVADRGGARRLCLGDLLG